MFFMTRKEYCNMPTDQRGYTDGGEPTVYVPSYGWVLVDIEV
jgi:hypothetical protein